MSPPWMPLYIGDYLADTAHLRTIEHGAYLLLIMHYWRTGGLPAEETALSRIARLTTAEWKRSRDVLAALFSEGWKHKRIEFEMTEAERISEAGRRGGVASGIARREKAERKRTTVERPSNDQANDLATISEALHSPSPSPTPEANASGERHPKSKRPRREPEVPLPDDWRPSEADKAYGASLNLTESEITREAERFRNGARSKDRRLSDWSMGFRNWLLKATEFLGREPRKQDGEPCARVGFYAAAASDELEAWDTYRQQREGKTYPKDGKGGWNFPTQWPPADEALEPLLKAGIG